MGGCRCEVGVVAVELFVGERGHGRTFPIRDALPRIRVYRPHGVPRMHERPQAALFHALRQLGYRIDSPNNRLPALIHGSGPRRVDASVSIEESSQFASALLLCANRGGWELNVSGENADESPYVLMTSGLIKAFPRHGGTFQIEPDASSASYFWGAADSALDPAFPNDRLPVRTNSSCGWTSTPTVRVAREPRSGWQIDANFSQEFSKIRTPIAALRLCPEGRERVLPSKIYQSSRR